MLLCLLRQLRNIASELVLNCWLTAKSPGFPKHAGHCWCYTIYMCVLRILFTPRMLCEIYTPGACARYARYLRHVCCVYFMYCAQHLQCVCILCMLHAP